ncbi:Lytic transglycosylase catalytic [Chloroherpeton thalassium ATCC 35110]|uniref:Lytic transglycosylase catalytic n=1 Tax=Chloroherpeton thalassium (strain ATCC 35110 / GB-78) TaxID=517418 RepID=B3QU47_CHLT3|nr:transporter substrate-binding domain-containing protein [Chloroherpeton thalassium]ACF12845.1 Lytic transglycosylase catalytic [Chloroherpeton thalassium ATCC 35110]
MRSNFPRYLIVGFTIFSLACSNEKITEDTQSSKEDHENQPSVHIDLPQIKKRKKLIAITSYCATCYFIYRGKPMGFEYELLERLAKHLDVDLEIVVAENLNDVVKMLNEGKGDIIAYGMTITQARQKKLAFTEHYTTTRQVLVQRKPNNWRRMKHHQIEKSLIRNQIDLIGKSVHVRRNSSYYARLKTLSNELGGDINIVEVPGYLETEELIQMVAEGKIDYTVADQNIAFINKTYYPDLDVETPISFPQKIAWAVRKNSPELLAAVDDWILETKRTTDYHVIYNKYFKNRKAYKRRIESPFYSKTGEKISQYDALIKKSAKELGWDWLLLASMIYQESRFDPNATSWVGAKGLMQVVPETAEPYGVTNLYDPKQNILAGTKYLIYLMDFWKTIPDSLERIKFVMASYNVGAGHILDAQRLAEKYGSDPNVWTDHVEKYILLKSEKKYYYDEAVRNGYCRGAEPYNYVREIWSRYSHYRQVLEISALRNASKKELISKLNFSFNAK